MTKFSLVSCQSCQVWTLLLSPNPRHQDWIPVLWCQNSLPSFLHLCVLPGTRAPWSVLLGTMLCLLRICSWLFTVLTLWSFAFSLQKVIRIFPHYLLSPPHCHGWSMTSTAISVFISKRQWQLEKGIYLLLSLNSANYFYEMHVYIKYSK